MGETREKDTKNIRERTVEEKTKRFWENYDREEEKLNRDRTSHGPIDTIKKDEVK